MYRPTTGVYSRHKIRNENGQSSGRFHLMEKHAQVAHISHIKIFTRKHGYLLMVKHEIKQSM
jgi:hypothetical protein